MSFDLTKAVLIMNTDDLTSAEKSVLVALAHSLNDETGRCFPGMDTLIKITKLSKNTIIEARKQLKEKGFIEFESTKGRLSNRYKLNAQRFSDCTVNGAVTGLNGAVTGPEQRSNKESNKEERKSAPRKPCDSSQSKNKKKASSKEKEENPHSGAKHSTHEETAMDTSLLPNWIDLEVWNDFRSHRREMKARMTELAEKYLLRDLEKLKNEGHDPNEAMCKSIASGWKSVVTPKREKKPIGANRNARLRAAFAQPDSEDAINNRDDFPQLVYSADD